MKWTIPVISVFIALSVVFWDCEARMRGHDSTDLEGNEGTRDRLFTTHSDDTMESLGDEDGNDDGDEAERDYDVRGIGDDNDDAPSRGRHRGSDETRTPSPSTDEDDESTGDDADSKDSATQNPPQGGGSTRKPSTSSTPAPSTGVPSTNGEGNGWQNDMLKLVNQERAKEGLKPLCINNLLTKLASAHAADMVARNFYDHTNPDGQDPMDRIMGAMKNAKTVGENIDELDGTVEQVMKDWMGSEAHRENIMDPHFNLVGFGHVGNKWAQNFAQSSSDTCG